MNEAETRAELIDPALKAAGWGVVEASRVRREVITLGRLQGAGVRAAQDIADYVLTYRNHKFAVIEAKRRDLPDTEGLGQAKKYAEKLQTRFAYSTNGAGIYQVDMTTGAEAVRRPISHPGRTLESCFRGAECLARPLRRHPVRGQGRLLAGALLPGHRHKARAGGHCGGSGPHPADAGDRHRQDLHRVPARLEAVPEPLEPRRLEARNRAHPAAAHPVPGRPQHPRRPGLQRVLGLPGRRARADRPRDHPQEGPRAEEREYLLHHLPDLHDRPGRGRAARAELRRLPARLLRLHRHRRMPSRRRERRRQLARHPKLFRARRAARPDGDAQAQSQCRYLRLFRRAGLHLLPEGRDQRRLPHALQGEADRHHARRLRLYQRRRDDRGRGRGRAALHRKRVQPHHRDRRARKIPRDAVHGHHRPEPEDPGFLRHPGPCATW